MKKKPWVLVHVSLFNPIDQNNKGHGLKAEGFAIFSTEWWQKFLASIPKTKRVTINYIGSFYTFKNKEDFLQHLQVTPLNETKFRLICETVLNLNGLEIQSRIEASEKVTILNNPMYRPVVEYGAFSLPHILS